MLQPDLGTTMIIAVISMSQIFISGVNLFYFVGAVIAGVGASLLLILTSEYRKARLLTFLQQNGDPLGRDYHIRQILYALGAGGFFGVGLGQSKQKFLFLPETATDSIFAIIAEEIGFVGASLIIFTFIFFTLRILKIAQKAPDRFSQVFAVGIAAWIGGQVFLNLGSMVAVVPLTGIPLPFISYGGNALVSILSGIGILLNISKHIS
jgi:cell division protein FtsW